MIDYRAPLCHTASMFRSSRKFIAVLMLLWLPLFSGNALAVSLSMQMPQGHCNGTDIAQMDMSMSQQDMDNMMSDEHCNMSDTADQHNQSCSDCGLCHLACTAYLSVPGIAIVAEQTASQENTPYLVTFHSFTSAPLVPPPLARA